MMLLSVEEVQRLHAKLISKTGGSDGLRDIGLLESAVYSANAGFDGYEIYSEIEQKAARLMYALVSNHAFVDGNKRIGTLVMLVTLKLNGIELKFTQKELINLALNVAKGYAAYDEILQFINSHKQ